MNEKIEKVCPKCGYDDTVLTFTPKGEKKHAEDKELFAKFGKLENRDPKYSHVTTLVIDKECIKVHCRTCQYAWITASLDAPTNAFNLNDKQIEEMRQDLNDSIPKPGFMPFDCEAMTQLYKEGGKVQPFDDKKFEDMFADIFNSGIFATEGK